MMPIQEEDVICALRGISSYGGCCGDAEVISEALKAVVQQISTGYATAGLAENLEKIIFGR